MFWKIKKMLVSSTNIKKYRAHKRQSLNEGFVFFFLFVYLSALFLKFFLILKNRLGFSKNNGIL
ncbi:hypothetical protein FVD94_06660 [Enterococcus faecium]|nr:hypothetical protein [Enterococcus faecium]